MTDKESTQDGKPQLEVIAVSDKSWRVNDQQFKQDGHGVLAYLDTVDGHVTVSIVSPPPVLDLVADSFSQALAIVRERVPAA